MPPFKTHEECRLWICVGCGNKADRPGLTQSQLDHIRRIYPQFDSQREHLPGSMCGRCRTKLKTFTPSDLSHLPALVVEMTALYHLRSQQCSCTYCMTVRARGNPSLKKKGGPPPAAPASVPEVAAPSPSSLEPSFEQLMAAPLALRERVASATLKEKMEQNASGPVTLKTGGRPVQVQVGPVRNVVPQIPVKALEKLQAETRCSNNTVLAVAKMNRQHYGRKSIEPGLKKEARLTVGRPTLA